MAGASNPHTLTFVTADNVKSLDTALAFDTWSTAVVEACTRRLVDYDMQARLVPDLASRWEVRDGGRTYLFHLRPYARLRMERRSAPRSSKRRWSG